MSSSVTTEAYSARRLTSSLAPVFVGNGPRAQVLRATAQRAAGGNAKILVTGESGVGKDVLVRFIHAHSPRAGHAFVALNCAGIAETLLESELFGHTRGSFTGAHRDKAGKLLMAHRGTIFLDEIGEMSLRMQALLLRFLENGELQPVGSDAPSTSVDTRVIAATNRDLQRMVAEGQFREDLYYRIKVVHLHVPPLRERREDIRDLITHMLAMTGSRLAIDDHALEILRQYRWPGNIRELHNVIEQATWLDSDGTITVQDLPPALVASAMGAILPDRDRRRQVADDLFEALTNGRSGFWEHVYPLFMQRDITRDDLRGIVRRGLALTSGSYRGLLALFGMESQEYKRFLNFLAAHECAVDFRQFRATGVLPGLGRPGTGTRGSSGVGDG
ncbi:MAG: sigma-54 dependent transcriptional regulator [Vicinamibacterales bacterium]